MKLTAFGEGMVVWKDGNSGLCFGLKRSISGASGRKWVGVGDLVRSEGSMDAMVAERTSKGDGEG